MKPTQTQVTIVLGLAAVGVVYFLGRSTMKKAGDALDYGIQQITPWNHDNVFASTVNKIGGAIVTDPAGPGKNADGTWSLGGFASDVQNLFGVSSLGMVYPPVAVADLAVAGIKKAAGALYKNPPAVVKASEEAWAHPTQYSNPAGDTVGLGI